MFDLNGFAKQSYEVAKIRGTVNAETMLKHCATEVVEAVQAKNAESRQNYIGELADVINCILILSANENIDIEMALTQCLEKNTKRAQEGK